MNPWFCVVAGAQLGPFSWQELLELTEKGTLGRDDLVWTADFGEEWKAATAVEGLFAPTPPEVDKVAATWSSQGNPVSETPAAQGPASKGTPAARPVVYGAQATATNLVYPFGKQPAGATDRPSCFEAGGRAWAHMKRVLFKPFNAARWFSLGLCYFLAMGVRSSGGSSSGNSYSGSSGSSSANSGNSGVDSIHTMVESAQSYISENPGLITMMIGIIILVSVISLAVGVVFAWLRARGAFMVMHRAIFPDATIKESWAQAKGVSMSLFWWWLGFGLLCTLLVTMLVVGWSFNVFIPMYGNVPFSSLAGWIGIWGGLSILVGVVYAFVVMMLENFVIPVMYFRQKRCMAAWAEVTELFRNSPWAVVRFWLYLWLVSAVALFAIVLAGLATCCVGFLVMAIPYMGTVIMLPYFIFLRYIGIEYLLQIAPDLYTENP